MQHKLLPSIKLLAIALVLVSQSFLPNLAAQTNSNPTARPKIGLVLGGGGARGAAHIGVLRVLEEHKIPIDFIAGTSMGAIVGGAYASGMSPDEIEAVLNAMNWADLFTDESPRQDLSFRRKAEQAKLLPLEMGVSSEGIRLPRGALAGRKLEFVLESTFIHTTKLDDFDQLPIPFRAVATNIETGEPAVIGSGSLSAAIRASMSIPGAFSPVLIDGHLVDGYVSMNVPIEVVRKMGADLIIAVDVGTPLAKVEKLSTLFAVMNQVGGIATVKNVQDQLKLLTSKDLLIVPDLGDRAVTDFEKVPEIIPLGYQAARAKDSELSRFTQADDVFAAFLKTQRQLQVPAILIDEIVVRGDSRVPKQTVLAQLQTKSGQKLDFQILQEDLNRIYALDAFERVNFKLEFNAGKTALVILVYDKAWGPDYLRLGLQFTNDFSTDATYNVLTDYTMTWLNKFGAEWKNQVQVGRTLMLFSEFYQPLDYTQRFFVAPSFEAKQSSRDVYTDGDKIAEYETKTLAADLQFGVRFGSTAELRAGLSRGMLKADPEVGLADLPNVDADRGGYKAAFGFDNVDNIYFPRHGTQAIVAYLAESTDLGGETDYEKITFKVTHAMSAGQHTLLGGVSGGINPGEDAPYYDSHTLGGLFNLSGLHQYELVGRQMALGRLIYYYQLKYGLVSFVKSSYLGGSIEGGNVWDETSDIQLDDLATSGSVFVAADTLIGPVYLAYGLSDEAHSGMLYLYLGQRF